MVNKVYWSTRYVLGVAFGIFNGPLCNYPSMIYCFPVSCWISCSIDRQNYCLLSIRCLVSYLLVCFVDPLHVLSACVQETSFSVLIRHERIRFKENTLHGRLYMPESIPIDDGVDKHYYKALSTMRHWTTDHGLQ